MNQAVSEVFAPILFQLGIGGIGGFFIGYATRKVAKVALLLGVVLFSLIFLAYTNVIGIDYGGLARMVSNFVVAINPTLVLLAPPSVPFALCRQPHHWSRHRIQKELISVYLLLRSIERSETIFVEEPLPFFLDVFL